MDDALTPLLARKTWRSLEAVHGMIYFTSHAAAPYAAAGVTKPRTGYFASRVAAMGAVPTEVVIATFYNFNPALVRRAMDGVWTLTTPDAIIAARYEAVDASLRAAFDDEVLGSSELAEAAELVRRAALVAVERPEGRPLFAGHASLSWPDEPHMVLWHGQTLLREFRGDAHIAALTLEGLSGIEALISHAGSGDVPAPVLQASRAWSDEEWAAGVAGMADKGLVDRTGAFTEEGTSQRSRIEDLTDRSAFAPYEALGADACASLRATGKRLSQLVVAAGLMTVDPKRFLAE